MTGSTRQPRPEPARDGGPPRRRDAALSKALEGFAGAVGFDAVLTSDEELQEFRDPYTYPEWNDFAPSAVVLPAAVEELQEILQVANELRVPLWTSSQGRNNGYGGPAPRSRGAVCLSRRRTIKDALDPNGILSPGKQGIWAKSMRPSV